MFNINDLMMLIVIDWKWISKLYWKEWQRDWKIWSLYCSCKYYFILYYLINNLH